MINSIEKKVLLAGILGTSLQWYDFAIFGYFSSIISKIYFPSDNYFIGLLSVFGIFAVGYLLAPIGAVFFGYIGDRYGRKFALTLSIMAMAISTAMISIVPGYKVIGIAAPILITFLRIIQGFVSSSEFTGSAIFLIEHAPSKKKALFGCLTSSAYSAGLILAGLSASFLSASFMPEWAWRLGFAVALIGGLIILYFRLKVTETPDFQLISRQEMPHSPLITALKYKPLAMVGVVGIAWLVGIMTFGTYVFAASFMHIYSGIKLSTAIYIVSLALICDALLEPFVATLADKIGLLIIICFGMFLIIFCSVPLFHLIASHNAASITIGMILMSCLIAIVYAPLNAYMISLFPSQYRYSGFGVAFHVGISLFGGTTPLFMLWLVHNTGNLIAPAWYYVFGGIVGLFSVALCEFQKMDKLVLLKAV